MQGVEILAPADGVCIFHINVSLQNNRHACEDAKIGHLAIDGSSQCLSVGEASKVTVALSMLFVVDSLRVAITVGWLWPRIVTATGLANPPIGFESKPKGVEALTYDIQAASISNVVVGVLTDALLTKLAFFLSMTHLLLHQLDRSIQFANWTRRLVSQSDSTNKSEKSLEYVKTRFMRLRERLEESTRLCYGHHQRKLSVDFQILWHALT